MCKLGKKLFGVVVEEYSHRESPSNLVAMHVLVMVEAPIGIKSFEGPTLVVKLAWKGLGTWSSFVSSMVSEEDKMDLVVFPPLQMACNPSNEESSLVECLSKPIAHTSMALKWHSFSGCLFLQRGQNIAIDIFSSSCFLLLLRVYRWLLIVLRISFLRFSNRFPNSILVSPLVVGFPT